MSGAAVPHRFIYERGSTQNGAITDYTFHVTTTNYLQSEDIITIKMPVPVFASENSKCVGVSSNLEQRQPCLVSKDLSSVQITLRPDVGFRQLAEGSRSLQSVRRIQSGEGFTLRITEVKNPFSEKPTDDAFVYSVLTNQWLIEKSEFSHMLRVNNTIPGDFDRNKTSVVPNNFQLNRDANYTLTFSPVNYE